MVLKLNVKDLATPPPTAVPAAIDSLTGAIAAVSEECMIQTAARKHDAVQLAQHIQSLAVAAAAREFRQHDWAREDMIQAEQQLKMEMWEVAWDGEVRKSEEKAEVIEGYFQRLKEAEQQLGDASYECLCARMFLARHACVAAMPAWRSRVRPRGRPTHHHLARDPRPLSGPAACGQAR